MRSFVRNAMLAIWTEGCLMGLYGKIKWRIEHYITFYKLNKIDNMEEFIDLVYEKEDRSFLDAWGVVEKGLEHPRVAKREMFDSLFNYLNYDFSDSSVLELGPGCGVFLDYAKDNGADEVEYIDYYPYFYHYNRLRGYNGYKQDYFSKGAFKGINNKYDLIMSRGSVNSDRLNRMINRKHGFFYNLFRLDSFDEWIRRLEKLIKNGGMVILSPSYDRGESEDIEEQFKCDREKFLKGDFCREMLERGYKFLPDVDGWTNDNFPYTFIKEM